LVCGQALGFLQTDYRIASRFSHPDLLNNPIRICALRVSFTLDEDETTTGTGQFLMTSVTTPCPEFVVDPAPHKRAYFQDHIRSLANYYNKVSGGKVVIDTLNSTVFPLTEDSSFQVSHPMAYYHPFLIEDSVDLRLSELLVDAVQAADPVVDFTQFDLVVVFHAGVGQDFAITLDPTPYDIPSAYMNKNDLKNLLAPDGSNFQGISVENGTAYVDCGIILPETQNHLLYDNYEDVFGSGESVCEYQFGLNGTFAFMFGFFLGLPSLYNTETGYTGIGTFGLMDQGSANLNGLIPATPSAWERTFLGWETPVVAGKSEEVTLKTVSSGRDSSLWKIPINANEYFLMENRCAYVRPGVSLDSIQYRIYEKNGEDEWPSIFPLIRDSLKAVFSPETGVLLSVPHYDYGIPGSGLLIWHVDESIINANLAANQVNIDRDHRGVDLEEGDGAQDLGYDAGTLASDVNDGWFFDPWFAGNEGFIDLNSDYSLGIDKRVGFTPFTNPSSWSNNFAFTGIYVDSIGPAGETMTFRISQKGDLENFPVSLNEEPVAIFPVDLNPADQSEEILVIADSIRIFNATGQRVSATFANAVNVINGDSLIVYGIDSSLRLSARGLNSTGSAALIDTLGFPGQTLTGLPLPVKDGLLLVTQDNSGQDYLSYYQPYQHTISTISTAYSIGQIIGGNGNYFGTTSADEIIQINLNPFSIEVLTELPDAVAGTLAAAFINENESPDLIHCADSLLTLILDAGATTEIILTRQLELSGNLALADIDGDGKIEIITAGANHLYAFNEDLTIENNFPVNVPFILTGKQFGGEILATDLEGDGKKDIIINTSETLLAFNYKGDLLSDFPKTADRQLEKSGILINTVYGTAYVAPVRSNPTVAEYDQLSAVIVSSRSHETDDWVCYGGNPARQFYNAMKSQSSPIASKSLLNHSKTFNWPNPAKNNQTFIRYFPNHDCQITIDIYDLAGDLVASFRDSAPLVGEPNEKEWNTGGVESGVYFAVVKAQSGSKSDSQIVKILVVK